MKHYDIKSEEHERTVVKSLTTQNVGVEPTRQTRNAIGYLLRGEKYIHKDDKAIRISQGDIFFLGQGTHYVENIPAMDGTFEQILFYYSPNKMQQVIATLKLKESDLETVCDKSTIGTAVSTPSKITRNFFMSANRHYEYGGFLHNTESERLHLAELAYNIITTETGEIRDALLQSLDQEKAEFERIIYSNMLNDKSVDTLASECSRSLTSFKKEFKRIFGIPPHQWYLRQRLNHAKLLLSTTRDSISQIGAICAFPNTSHFIKLFKRNYGVTPAVYRTNGRIYEITSSAIDELIEMRDEAATSLVK